MGSMPGLQQSFVRVLFILAQLIIVLIGLRLAAPFLNPFLFALIFSIIFAPVHRWLKRRLPAGLALFGMLLGLVACFGLLFGVMTASLRQFSTQLAFYTSQLERHRSAAEAWFSSLGIEPPINPATFFSSEAVVAVIGTLAAALAGFLGSFFFILMLLLFFLAEGPAIIARLRAAVGERQPQLERLVEVGQQVMRQFGLRAIVNAITGAAIALWLALLGVDFPILWGILTFFLSYIPYIGIVLATIPAMVLALAEFGLAQALLVVVGVAVANIAAENLLSPLLMSRGLPISPTVVFVAFAFWTWLLGAPGAFVGLPITFFLIAMLGSFPGTRWLAAMLTGAAPAARAAVTRPDVVDAAP